MALLAEIIVGCTAEQTSRKRSVKEIRAPDNILAKKSERVDAMEIGSARIISLSLISYSNTKAEAAATIFSCVIWIASFRLL